jgi:hypothetical protein
MFVPAPDPEAGVVLTWGMDFRTVRCAQVSRPRSTMWIYGKMTMESSESKPRVGDILLTPEQQWVEVRKELKRKQLKRLQPEAGGCFDVQLKIELIELWPGGPQLAHHLAQAQHLAQNPLFFWNQVKGFSRQDPWARDGLEPQLPLFLLHRLC